MIWHSTRRTRFLFLFYEGQCLVAVQGAMRAGEYCQFHICVFDSGTCVEIFSPVTFQTISATWNISKSCKWLYLWYFVCQKCMIRSSWKKLYHIVNLQCLHSQMVTVVFSDVFYMKDSVLVQHCARLRSRILFKYSLHWFRFVYLQGYFK